MFTTHTRFIANKASWENPAKRRKIENLALLLRAALEGEDKVGIKLNVNRSGLDKVLAALPALKNPTISPLANGDWVAVEAVVGEKVIRDLIPLLKENGAQGIVEYPLNKVVL
ncbi:MAG: hypothetical protein PHF70_13995 [Opitutales bacterium]|nr:hypothetical protein [Opitutales bacterium]